MTTPQIEACIDRIEREAKRAHPEIISLFVKPQTADVWNAKRMKLEVAAQERDS